MRIPVALPATLLTLFMASSLTPLTPTLHAQQDAQQAEKGGVLVRVDGDVEVPDGERYEVVVVVRGDARISGEVTTVVVVRGSAVLFGADVENLVVVSGDALLTNGTRVTGDVGLVDAELQQDEGSTVLGEINEGPQHQVFRGLWVFGLFIAIGYVIAMLAAGLIAAAIAPHGLRVAGQALSSDPLVAIIWTLGVWVALPLAAIFAIPTVIGIPVGVGTFLFVLPALAFLGYLITGVRLGDWIMEKVKHSVEQPRPYLAALAGIGTLLVLGLIPFLGGFVAPIAGALGSGALLLTLWRGVRSRPEVEYATAEV